MFDRDQARDYVRRYAGVSPGVLVDGAWLLRRRAFWLTLVEGSVDAELVDALFGDDDADELGDRVRQSGTWPVLTLGASPTDFALVYWHGHDHESGYDFVVLPAGSGRCVSVAALEGHGYGPGLSWAEAQRLVDGGRLGTPAQRRLLVLPALGDADMPEEAVGMVAAAFLAVGDPTCAKAVADEAARQVLDTSARWAWSDGALVCDRDDAVRRQGGMPAEDLRLVTEALAE